MNGATVRELAGTLSIRDQDLGHDIGTAVDRCFAPLRIQVSGRTGVGKTAVRRVLAAHHDLRHGDIEIVEAASIDVPRSPDPDLDGDIVVHVMASGVQPSDVAAVTAASEVVAVLAKADTLDDSMGVVRRASATLGAQVHPIMGTIASAVLAGRPQTFDALRPVAAALTSEMLLTPQLFLQADLELAQRTRTELVEQIETFGVGVVARALAANPDTDDATLRLLLAETSGAADVVRAVVGAVEGVRIDRQGALLHRLTELVALYPLITAELERYLGTDDCVVAIMRSALRALGEPEEPSPTLHTAALWRDRWQASNDPAVARAALAVTRGYTRLRSR